MTQIYFTHARTAKPWDHTWTYSNDLYTPIKKSELFGNYDFQLPHEHGDDYNSREAIRRSRALVADVTYPDLGVGIEIGWAQSMDKPIIIVHEEGRSPLPFVKYASSKIYSYSGREDVAAKILEALKQEGIV